MGELLHRHGERDGVSAVAAVPDAGARRRRDVARGDRGGRGGGEQRAQDRSRDGGPIAGSPKKLVFAGYGLASAVRPLIALAHAWPQVLAIRFIDRLGKGIRGAPRDAMLAALAPAAARGRVYGFHRAMDHAGAVTGPLIASAFLYFYPGRYRPLFALTIVPGIIVMLFILRIPEPARAARASKRTRAGNPRRTRRSGDLAPERLAVRSTWRSPSS